MRTRATALWLAAVTATAAAACAPTPGVEPATTSVGSTSTTAAPGAHSVDTGAIVIGIADEGAPRTLNPLLDGPDVGVLDLIGPAFLARGYDIDPDTRTPVPEVLEEIPSLANGGITVNPNGTMDVRVRVDAAARWADGTPITADDLAFTIETITDAALPIRSDLRARYDRIVPGSVRIANGELTFRMDVDASVELLFDVILPAHVVAGSDFVADWNETLWVSGGPFEVEAYQPGQYLTLQRNERYWKVDPATGDPLPLIDRLVVRFFEPTGSPDPRVERAFESRDLDVVLMSFAGAAADPYAALERDGARLLAAPGLAWEQINFQFGPGNRNLESLNQYRQFRQAVAHAIDRDALADRRGTYALASALWAYVPDLAQDPWAAVPYSPEETAALLFALGEELEVDLFDGGGPRVVITASSDSTPIVAMAGDIVVMLNEAGIAAELQLESPALFFGATLDNGTWDVSAWKLKGSPGRSGAITFIEMFDPEGLPFVGTNFFRWGTVDSTVGGTPQTARYAEIVDELKATVDPIEIDRLLVEAERILASEMVIMPLVVHEESGAVVWSDRVIGVTANPAQSELWNVEAWRSPAG